MSQIRQIVTPIARRMRSALGMHEMEHRLDELQSQLSSIEQFVQKSASQGITVTDAADTPVNTAGGASDEHFPPEPTYVHFTLPDGKTYDLSIPSVNGDAFLQAVASGGTQDTTWRFVIDWIKPGDVFFDLGANVGTFSIPAAVSGAEVHAFELLHENVSHIANAVQKNGLKNVSITLGATWDSPGCVGFGGYSAWGAVYVDTPVSVATITIDDYVRQKAIKKVDTMKIDVEGSEKWALKGASQLLQRDHPDIVIECNVIACGNNGYSYHDLLSFLEEKGYRLYRFHKNRLCPCDADVIQEVVYADYFATVRTPEEIRRRSGWNVSAMTQEEVIESIVEQDMYNEYHKAYVLANSDRLPPFVFADGRVAALLKKWTSLRSEPFFATLQTGSIPAHA